MAVLASFLQYLIIMVILIAVACLGWMVGKKLRLKKDAADADGATGTVITEDEAGQDQ